MGDIGRVVRARAILAAHDMAGRNRFQRADHLELFVPHGVGVEMIGRLHRDQAQKLHQVVLHHVAHRAGLVVIGAAPVHPHGFGHRDLDMVDVLGLPQRFEQDVGKADGHQVLDGFLAQVMVDPVDLRLGKVAGQRFVQRARAGQVAAKGFLQDDPAPGVGDAVIRQPLRDIAEQARRDGKVEGAHHVFAHQAG